MGLLSGITDFVGLTDSGAGERAAREAGMASGRQMDRARGELEQQFQPSLDITRTGFKNARTELGRGFTGARDEYDFGLGKSLAALSGGADEAYGRLDPIANAGLGALKTLRQGYTPGGFAGRIEDLRTGGSLDPLIAENERNLEAQLSSQGLGRSGYGITEMSQIPIETLMGIESDLYGRAGNVAQTALPAVYEQSGIRMREGGGVADLESLFAQQKASNKLGYRQDLAGLFSQQGLTEAQIRGDIGRDLANVSIGQAAGDASSILAGAQAEAADRGALQNIVGTGLGVYAGM